MILGWHDMVLIIKGKWFLEDKSNMGKAVQRVLFLEGGGKVGISIKKFQSQTKNGAFFKHYCNFLPFSSFLGGSRKNHSGKEQSPFPPSACPCIYGGAPSFHAASNFDRWKFWCNCKLIKSTDKNIIIIISSYIMQLLGRKV